jgi:oligopeptide/dipeptide ABC transporter ATP-binding protein
MTALLSVQELSVVFESEDERVRAVEDVSFEISKGQIVGLVGESGCGKTVTSLALMGLLPQPAGRISNGSIRLDGEAIDALEPAALRRIRGRRIAMIFQDPMKSLNPYLRLEVQLAEGARLHLGLNRKRARERAVELLTRVGIPDARARIRDYPHQLSGGMRQRAMIAMALLCDPDLLIADEPTTALDVTVQAQILALLEEICRERDTAILFITHDLGVVSNICERVIVMYAGRIVEEAPVEALFSAPRHPYTAALLRCSPRIDGPMPQRLESIEGLPPRLEHAGFDACSFAPRCPFVAEDCLAEEPALVTIADQQRRRCIREGDDFA